MPPSRTTDPTRPVRKRNRYAQRRVPARTIGDNNEPSHNPEYAAVPTIKRYILIEQDAVAVRVHARQANEPWNTTVLLAGSTLSTPEIGIDLLVTDFYDGVTFTDPAPHG